MDQRACFPAATDRRGDHGRRTHRCGPRRLDHLKHQELKSKVDEIFCLRDENDPG